MKIDKLFIFKLIFLSLLFILLFSPTFPILFHRFLQRDSYYSHGFLIPFIFIYLIWRKRGKISRLKINSSWRGLFFLLGGIFLHVIGIIFKVNFLSFLAIPFVIFGTVYCWLGYQIVKEILFPIAFLIFMLPLPQVVIINLAFKLKMLVAQTAAFLVKYILKIEVIRKGSILYYPGGYLIVGDPCSGLRSLISFLALGILISYFAHVSLAKKVLIFLFSIPVALLSNIIRVIFLLIISYIYGEKVALGFLHQLSGLLVFILGFFLLISLSNYFKRREILLNEG